MFITPEELNGGVMQISSKLYILLEQVFRCLIYVGIGHTAFEVVSIWRAPEVSHLWYYGLVVPGLYYLIPIVVLTIFLAIVSKR